MSTMQDLVGGNSFESILSGNLIGKSDILDHWPCLTFARRGARITAIIHHRKQVNFSSPSLS